MPDTWATGVEDLSFSSMGIAELLKKVNETPVTLLSTATERKVFKQQSKKHETAGPKWFDMPATPMTPELEKDLKVLQMRSAIDRKRHYKKGEEVGKSKYFQMGTIVSDATGFYSDRLTRKQRPKTLVDTLLKDAETQSYFKKKYNELQVKYQAKGRGAFSSKNKRTERPFKNRNNFARRP